MLQCVLLSMSCSSNPLLLKKTDCVSGGGSILAPFLEEGAMSAFLQEGAISGAGSRFWRREGRFLLSGGGSRFGDSEEGAVSGVEGRFLP